jgi:hypothetical protein
MWSELASVSSRVRNLVRVVVNVSAGEFVRTVLELEIVT